MLFEKKYVFFQQLFVPGFQLVDAIKKWITEPVNENFMEKMQI